MKVRCNADTNVGLKREINQDYFGIADPSQTNHKGHLVVVCDGMGGHAAGEVASRLGVETILELYSRSDDTDRAAAVEGAFFEANRRIYNQGQGTMGTTGVAALLYHNVMHIANVGDSRAYLIRNNQIEQISRDHSLVAEQVTAGILTPEQARHSNYRNMITRALGYRIEVQVDMFTIFMQEGDIILLSTDGLHGLVEDEELVEIVTGLDPENAVQNLIKLANERGGTDNITAAVAVIDEIDEDDRITPVSDDIARISSASKETQPLSHAASSYSTVRLPADPPVASNESSPKSPSLFNIVQVMGGVLVVLVLVGIGVVNMAPWEQKPAADMSDSSITNQVPTSPAIFRGKMTTLSTTVYVTHTGTTTMTATPGVPLLTNTLPPPSPTTTRPRQTLTP
jgi:protein phosphatase